MKSPLRGIEFVTRKITDAVARRSAGKQAVLELGNLDAKRDWGFAQEYVDGMYRMLQDKEPDTFVLATGRTETVRDFVTMTFRAAGVSLDWKGAAEGETGTDTKTGKTVVRVNPAFYRPAEVELLIGSAAKAATLLGWKATTSLEQLCQIMYDADVRRVRSEGGK